jgi:hypothetical protein
MKFEYTVEEGSEDLPDFYERFCSARMPQGNEKVIAGKENNGVNLIANKEGWLYLAKICVEMAYYTEKEPGYHFHRDKNFEWSSREDDLISFFAE